MEQRKTKIAVLTIAYNESCIIRACINNWKGKVDKHLILCSSLPWNGSPVEDDGTARIARDMGADVIIRQWNTEAEQREFGLAYLYNYDYVLIVDPDELYTEEDQKKILDRLDNPFDYINRTNQKLPIFKTAKMTTYWKTTDYIFDPEDSHQPIIAVDPKAVKFSEKRGCRMKSSGEGFVAYVEPIDITTHHLSWVKSNEKVQEKIQSYAHCNDFNTDYWYNEVWLKWKPGDMTLIRPYGIEKSVAIYKPAPQNILDLLK